MKELHEQMGNAPSLWKSYAENYLKSAKALDQASGYPEDAKHAPTFPSTFPLYVIPSRLILYAYAVECFLKALCIKAGGKMVENGELVDNFNTHNLNDLFKKAGIANLNKAQKTVLDILSYYMTDGRYPVSLRHTKMYQSIRKQNPGGGSTYSFWSLEKDEVLYQVIELLKKKYS